MTNRRQQIVVATVAILAAGGVAVTIAVGSSGASGRKVDPSVNPNNNAAVPRAPKDQNARAQPAPAGSSSFPLGILAIRQTPSHDFVQENEWHGLINGQARVVHAGSVSASERQSSTTGELLVTALDSGTDTAYTHASIPGPYSIKAANGAILTVAGGNGSTFSFNAETNQFGN